MQCKKDDGRKEKLEGGEDQDKIPIRGFACVASLSSAIPAPRIIRPIASKLSILQTN